MEEWILILGLAAAVVFGYYIVARFGKFLDGQTPVSQPQEAPLCLNVAVSDISDAAAAAFAFQQMNDQFPGLQFHLSMEGEKQALHMLAVHTADVAIVAEETENEEAAEPGGAAVDAACLWADQAEDEAVHGGRRKALWINSGAPVYVQEFICRLCARHGRNSVV
jgi:hypothetical protein